MSVDIASLVFEIDSTQATAADQNLDKLIATGARLDQVARQVKTSAGQMAGGLDGVASAAARGMRNATDYNNATGATGMATKAASAASEQYLSVSRDVASQLALNVRLWKQQASEQASATATMEKQAAAVDRLQASYDPLYATQMKAQKATSALDAALASGAITAERHAAMTKLVKTAAEDGAAGLGHLTTSAGLNRMQMMELAHVARSASDAIAAGASPFRVLAMEGGRLTQALSSGQGGMAGGLAALVGMINPAVVGIGLIAAATGGYFAILAAGEKEQSAFNNALTATHNYAGLTASSFEEMAERIAKSQNVSTGAARAGVEQLAASGKFTGDTIEHLVSAAEKFSQITGESVTKILAGYEAMKGGVVKWAVQHEESYHDLTLAQIDYIDALEKQGKHEQAELQLATDMDRANQAHAASYGVLQQAMHDTATWASKMWDAILGIGRPKTLDQQIQDQTAAILKMQGDPDSASGRAGNASAGRITAINSAMAKLGQLQASRQQENAKAASDAAKAKAEDDAIRKKYDNQAHKGPTTRNDTDQRADQVEQALQQAKASELQAQAQLTGDIQKRAGLERDALTAEGLAKQAQLDKLKASVDGDKGLSAATKATLDGKIAQAKSIEDQVTLAKQQLVDQRAEQQEIAKATEMRSTLAGYAERELSARASIATSAAEQNADERQAFDLRQQVETATLQAELAYQIKWGVKTQQEADSILAGAQRAQAEEAIAEGAKEQARLLTEQVQMQQNTLDQQKAVLQGQADLARSTAGRRAIDIQLLAIEQQQEHLASLKTLSDPTASLADFDKAGGNLATESQRYADKLKLLTRDAALVDFQELSGAITNMADAIKSHDFASAFLDLAKAIEIAKTDFKAAGDASKSAADQQLAQVSGVAAIASGIGSAIGGKGGAALSGAASGAVAGTAILPGIGTAIGAVLGGLSGLLGGGDSARKTAAQQAQQAENQRVATEHQQAQQLSIQLLQAQGNAEAAVNLQREQEIAGLDAYNQALARQVYAAQDAANMRAKQAELDAATATNAGDAVGALAIQRKAELETIRATLQPLQQAIYAEQDLKAANDNLSQAWRIQGQIADATGNKVSALAIARQQELAAMDASLRPIQQGLYAAQDLQTATDAVTTAKQNLTDAYNAAADGFKDTISAYQSIVTSLSDAINSLRTSAAGGGSLQSQYSAAKGQFADLVAATKGDPNDPATKAAFGGLAASEQAFLGLSQQTARTQLDYARDAAQTKATLSASKALAQNQVDVQQQQLNALTTQVGALTDINGSVMKVEDAVAALAQAEATQASAQQTANTAMQAALQQLSIIAQAAADAASAAAAAANTASAAASAASSNASASPNYAGYVDSNPDLLSYYDTNATQLAAMGYGSEAAYGQFHYATYGAGEGRTLPHFATGGMHAGGLRVVGEEGPELEATGPSRIWNAADTQRLMAGNDNGDVLGVLSQILAAIQQGNANTAKTAGLMDTLVTLWRRVTRDGNSLIVTNEAA